MKGRVDFHKDISGVIDNYTYSINNPVQTDYISTEKALYGLKTKERKKIEDFLEELQEIGFETFLKVHTDMLADNAVIELSIDQKNQQQLYIQYDLNDLKLLLLDKDFARFESNYTDCVKIFQQAINNKITYEQNKLILQQPLVYNSPRPPIKIEQKIERFESHDILKSEVNYENRTKSLLRKRIQSSSSEESIEDTSEDKSTYNLVISEEFKKILSGAVKDKTYLSIILIKINELSTALKDSNKPLKNTTNKIIEIRVDIYRIYYFRDNEDIIFLHAGVKDGQDNDIRKADIKASNIKLNKNN
ncbi:MAG: type II toxin-antitoxin system RelE/ParE family toxin [Parachlamydiales bacterium]|nr:type II toxin-antitoxin system RelE/ParE family toxin [Parachlamydiales bacterium]